MSKIARIFNDKRLEIKGELIEGDILSLKSNGDFHVNELVEDNVFSISQGRVDVFELIENVFESSFNPSSISDMTLWLDASKIQANNGDTITQWNDLSGNDNHVVQSNIDRKPKYETVEHPTPYLFNILKDLTPRVMTPYTSLGDDEFSSNSTYSGGNVSVLRDGNPATALWVNGGTFDIYLKTSTPTSLDRITLNLTSGYGSPATSKLFRRVGDDWEFVEDIATLTAGVNTRNIQNNTLESTGWLIRLTHTNWIGINELGIYKTVYPNTTGEISTVNFTNQWLTTNKAWNNFAKNNEYTSFVVGRNFGSSIHGTAGHDNFGFYGDKGGYIGLIITPNGVGAYNWDTTSKIAYLNKDFNFFLATTQLSDGVISLRLNGDAESFTSTGNTNTSVGVLDIGMVYGRYMLSGDISEILIFNRKLSIEERQQIEQYLMAKWRVI